MTLTDRANRALKQIDAELAVCDAATPGKWFYHDGMVTCTLPPLLEPHERPCNVAKCHTESVFRDKNITHEQMHGNARFIATARTGYPAALRGLKVAIEGFLKLANSDVSADEAHACNHPCDASEHLNSILTIWEGGRE